MTTTAFPGHAGRGSRSLALGRSHSRDWSTVSVQYRVVVGKKDELVDGPDDADVVVTVPLVEVRADGFDPTVAYMRGKLKSTGSDRARCSSCCKSGEAAAASAGSHRTSLSSR